MLAGGTLGGINAGCPLATIHIQSYSTMLCQSMVVNQ